MIDLRSDTVTKPTEEMREVMYKAEVGDDVYSEDPTVNKLEELAAKILGKEAALFVTSGTQGNQIAVLSHTRPGDEIILEAESHIFYYEAGAVGALAGVQTRIIKGENGQMPVSDIAGAIRAKDLHQPNTALVSLENTHNRAGGVILPVEYMKKVYSVTEGKVPIHLDGARLFNAAVGLGIDVKEITKYVDTVQICLSKGLSAPVGSLLAGSKEWINIARRWRKRLGGGMRQAGVIAAPGIIALTKMVDRLSEDHKLARQLALGLSEIEGIIIDPNKVQTNIVIIDIASLDITAKQFADLLKEKSILSSVFSQSLIRLTTHREINESDIDYTIEKTREIVKDIRKV